MILRTSIKQKNKPYLLVSLVIICASFAYLFLQLLTHKNVLTTAFNPKQAEKKYNASQWNKSANLAPIKVLNAWARNRKDKYSDWNHYVSENKEKVDTEKVKRQVLETVSKTSISDTELYAYAGYRYIRGENPILINSEVPPLGKYIIGASIILFKNQYVASLLFAIIAIGLAAYITWRLSKKSMKAVSLSILFMCTSSFIVDQTINAPQLEIFQLVFLLLSAVFVSKYFEKKHIKDIIFAGLFAGAFAATKIFIFSAALMLGMVMVTLMWRRAKIREIAQVLIVFLMAISLVLLLSYASFFIHKGTFQEFLGVQKWIYAFYRDSNIDIMKLLGSYIPLVFINKWRVWSEGYPTVAYDQWSLLWPTFFVTGIVSALSLIKARPEKTEKLFLTPLVSFAVVYAAALICIPIFPRYLTLLYPLLYIFTAVWFDKLLKLKK